jgi:2OG-Fe(II) oxygenase superfamily
MNPRRQSTTPPTPCHHQVLGRCLRETQALRRRRRPSLFCGVPHGRWGIPLICLVLLAAATASVASSATGEGAAAASEASSSSASHRKDDEILDVTVNPDGSTTTTVRLAPTRNQEQRVQLPKPVEPRIASQAPAGGPHRGGDLDELDEEDFEDEGELDEDYDEDEFDEDYEEDGDFDEEGDSGEDSEYGNADFDACVRSTEGAERTLEDAKRCYGVAQSTNGYDPSFMMAIDDYMRNVVSVEPKYESVRHHCRNQDALCTYWASLGECEANAGYMLTSCGPACHSCDKIIYEERCPVDPNLRDTNAWKAGDLNRFFERIVTHPYYQQFQPNVLCRPGTINPHSQRDCPWVVTLDNVLSDQECESLIEQGAMLGYERSEDVGERNPDGSYGSVKSSGRTSTNAWCSDACLTNETVQSVIAKLENLTGIPDANSEFLQLLRYEVGQFYESHHDFIEHDVDRASGPRILTVFLYLNDVEGGGATHFTNLDLSVYPKRGRVLLWPSVLDDNPNVWDDRTHHQAQPVLEGIKYGANSWVRSSSGHG